MAEDAERGGVCKTAEGGAGVVCIYICAQPVPAPPAHRTYCHLSSQRGTEPLLLGYSPTTHSSVTFLGIPLGRALRCLLLQRTTVSRQVHSCGHWGRGMQLVSSLPAPGMESHQVTRVQPLGIV